MLGRGFKSKLSERMSWWAAHAESWKMWFLHSCSKNKEKDQQKPHRISSAISGKSKKVLVVSHLERLANSARLLITMSWREKQSPTEKSESESQGFWGTQLEAHSQELDPFAIKCFAHKSTSAYHATPWALVEDEAKWIPTGQGFLRLLRELSSCSHKLGNRVADSISDIVISYFLTPKFVSLAPDQGCWLETKGMKPIWQP